MFKRRVVKSNQCKIVLLIAVCCCLLYSCQKEAPKAKINKDGTALAVTDHSGRFLWQKRFNQQLNLTMDPVVCDLENDGVYEILVGQGQIPDSRYVGFLHCFEDSGDLKWDLILSSESFKVPYQIGGQFDWGPRFLFFPAIWSSNFIIVDDLDGDGIREIVLTMGASGPFNPHMIMVLDSNGRRRGHFWTPGVIHHLKISDSFYASKKVFIVSSLDSHLTPMDEKQECLYYHSVFMLDAAAFDAGQSPLEARPPGKEDRTLPDCCLWYRLLPHLDFMTNKRVKALKKEIVVGIKVLPRKSKTQSPEIEVNTSGGLTVRLNGQGAILDVRLNHIFRKELESSEGHLIERFENQVVNYYSNDLFFSHN